MIRKIVKYPIENMQTVKNTNSLRIGKIRNMKKVCVRTTHCVDMTRIPCKQCNVPADFAFL